MRVYALLIASLVATKLAIGFVAIDFKTAGQALMFEWWFLAVLAVYGAAGVLLLRPAGFPGVATNRRGVLIAGAHGIPLGLAAIAVDAVRPLEEVLHLASAHHPLPEGLLVYWHGCVVSEIWFHLLPVPLLVFLGSRLKDRQAVFWVVACLVSFWEARRVLTDPDLWVATEIVRAGITYAANLSEIWLFRRYGFLAAIAQRLTSYALWHLAWPLVRG